MEIIRSTVRASSKSIKETFQEERIYPNTTAKSIKHSILHENWIVPWTKRWSHEDIRKPIRSPNIYRGSKQDIHKQDLIQTKPKRSGTCLCYCHHNLPRQLQSIIWRYVQQQSRSHPWERRSPQQNERLKYNPAIQVQHNNFTPYHERANKPVLMEVDNSVYTL